MWSHHAKIAFFERFGSAGPSDVSFAAVEGRNVKSLGLHPPGPAASKIQIQREVPIRCSATMCRCTLYEEQLRRWSALSLTPPEREEVDRLSVQILRVKNRIAAILALAGEVRAARLRLCSARAISSWEWKPS